MHLNRYRVPLTQPPNRPQPTTPLKPAFEWAAGQLLARSCAVASASERACRSCGGPIAQLWLARPAQPFDVRSPLIHDPISLRLGCSLGELSRRRTATVPGITCMTPSRWSKSTRYNHGHALHLHQCYHGLYSRFTQQLGLAAKGWPDQINRGLPGRATEINKSWAPSTQGSGNGEIGYHITRRI
ncbi:hypothetical protein J3E69DRAFT_343999, partial [Trichoderma sp. SZMC 28015]